MLIDCGTCTGRVRGRCGDCVVTVLAQLPAQISRRAMAQPPRRAPGWSEQAHPSGPAPASASRAGTATDGWSTDGRERSFSANIARPARATEHPTANGWPLDENEAAAVELFVRAGLVDADHAAAIRALPAVWRGHRAVG